MKSFGSHRENTDRSLKVSISSYRHRSDLVRCGNGSGETTVVEEDNIEQMLSYDNIEQIIIVLIVTVMNINLV